MADKDKVFDAIRNCITEPKCRDCPWEDCERFDCKRVDVPLTLLLDTLKLLKEQEHKDKMFHALEEDWKRLKELLKEQEEEIKHLHLALGIMKGEGIIIK